MEGYLSSSYKLYVSEFIHTFSHLCQILARTATSSAHHWPLAASQGVTEVNNSLPAHLAPTIHQVSTLDWRLETTLCTERRQACPPVGGDFHLLRLRMENISYTIINIPANTRAEKVYTM